MLQKRSFALFAHARNAVQLGAIGALGVLFMVIGDGEAVDFLLYPSDQGEQGGALLNAQLAAVGRHQGAGAVTVILDHAENGNVGQAQPAQGFARCAGMHFAAVNQQQIGALFEFLIAVQIAAEAPRQHLAHGRIVIRCGQCFDLEAAIVALERLAVCKDHHGGHHIIAAGMGNIIGLHAAWRFG